MDGLMERMDEVFQYLDRIRETIVVGQAMENAEQDLLANVEHVYRTWLLDLPSDLLRLKKPLYAVTLNAENSLNASATIQKPNQKMLNQFITTILSPSDKIAKIIPPYFLKIHKDFFSCENYQTFTDFLTSHYTVGLVGMSMSIPNNGGSMNFIFSCPPSFPLMRQLRILFFDQGTAEAGFGSNFRFVPFLQLILQGANQLEKLVFNYCRNSAVPTQLKYLTFPSSLTSLYLKCELTSQQLEPLTASFLPNLRHFGVMISPHTLKNKLLGRVLDRFKASLRTLYFYGIKLDKSCTPRPMENVSYFYIPEMEFLKLFSTSSLHAEWERGHFRLQMALPKLKHLWLKQQTRKMFEKWTRNTCFSTVTNLGVGLVNDKVSEVRDHDISISVLQMERLHSTFPNVTVLNLNVAEDLSGLICLFSARLKLTELKLVVKRVSWRSYWDPILIGVSPVDGMEKLLANPQSPDSPIIDPNLPSIRRFTALRFLTLSAPILPGIDIEEQDSLISDAVFLYAFLQMPNLNRLHFAGMFKASSWATQIWESWQRSINYTTFDDADEKNF